ncbi:MAG: hypothetical protein ABSA27_02715 [Terriglobales bacterium]|jgi:radical SAM superfamily enzyme
MARPHLVIIKEIDGTPVQGVCSSCKDAVFDTSASAFAREHKQSLKDQFREHFRSVHEREDASQSAARIVKKATED